MAHTHDRTLLAKLGFADPDKKDARHDLACRYAALPESALAVAKAVMWWELRGPLAGDRVQLEDGLLGRVTGVARADVDAAQFEVPLSKGRDQYKTTIGFLDARLRVAYWLGFVGEKRHVVSWTNITPRDARRVELLRSARKFDAVDVGSELLREPFDGEVEQFPRDVVVEVKIAPESAANSLRQIGLYREHVTPEYRGQKIDWLLITAYPLSAGDVDMLRSQGVAHLKLGPRFDEFVARERAAAAAAGNDEL